MGSIHPMVRVPISPAAFEAIEATLPLGSVGYEREFDDNGDRLIWLEPHVLAKLRALRGPGESYSDVIPSGWSRWRRAQPPPKRSGRMTGDGLRSCATPHGRLSSRFRGWSGRRSIADISINPRNGAMGQKHTFRLTY